MAHEHLKNLTRTFSHHTPLDEKEKSDVNDLLEFISRYPNPFDRTISEGHITGSGVVISWNGDKVLLLHHKKLKRWQQPGGHAEVGEETGETVALREAKEETGIEGLLPHPVFEGMLHLDKHRIPEFGKEPAHFHYDLRYILVAPPGVHIKRQIEETNDLRWFSFDELESLNLDSTLLQLLNKVQDLVQNPPIYGERKR